MFMIDTLGVDLVLHLIASKRDNTTYPVQANL